MTSRAILPEPLNAAPLRGGVPLHAFIRLRCFDYVQKNIKNGPPGASKARLDSLSSSTESCEPNSLAMVLR